jgi:hypothetical protein
VTRLSRQRWASGLFLAVLIAVQLLPLSPALGAAGCLCDETMCVHQAHRHTAATAKSREAASPPAANTHCGLPAAAEPDCTMGGCGHESDAALLALAPGTMPPARTTMALQRLSDVAPASVRLALDRSTPIEPPPPDTASV